MLDLETYHNDWSVVVLISVYEDFKRNECAEFIYTYQHHPEKPHNHNEVKGDEVIK